MRGRQARLLGVDGGGSSTVAWIADGRGRVIGRGEDGPSNIKAVGESRMLGALEGAVRSAWRDAGEAARPVDSACLGLAGCDRPDDRALLESWNAEGRLASRLSVVNDGELVLAAGTPEGWGIAVIAGTGSIAVGRSPIGRSARAGGWGHVFGDEGSAYGVAVAALRRAARRHDGRDPGGWEHDPLTRATCEAVGVDDPSGLVGAIYAEGFDRARLAAILPAILLRAADDPSLGRDLLEPAGHALAETAVAVAGLLGLPRGPLPLAMAGGLLLASEPVAASLVRGLAEAGFQAESTAVEEPVLGAVRLAHRALDAKPSGTGRISP